MVLVDQMNNPIGTRLKAEVHTAETPLHRAFSCFLFNGEGQLLLQQRAKSKKTWPLIWSNSCCGHPMPGEPFEDAVRRRLDFELGMDAERLYCMVPRYNYRYEMFGVVEHEICPVFVAYTLKTPKPNPSEVEQIFWISWESFLDEIESRPERYSQWCVDEAWLLEKSDIFQEFLNSIMSASQQRPLYI